MRRLAFLLFIVMFVGCSDEDDNSNNANNPDGCQTSTQCGDGETCVRDGTNDPGLCAQIPVCDPASTQSECTGGCRWETTAVSFEYDGTACTNITPNVGVCVGLSLQPCLNGCPGETTLWNKDETTSVLLYTDNGLYGDEWTSDNGTLQVDCPDLYDNFF